MSRLRLAIYGLWFTVQGLARGVCLKVRSHVGFRGLGLEVLDGVHLLQQVAQLLTALQLVLRHPRVQQLLLVLFRV